jgi:hypothetical protein
MNSSVLVIVLFQPFQSGTISTIKRFANGMKLTLLLGLCGVGTAMGVALASGVASAHPGGLNQQGCHNNRKTGEYHCHRAGRSQRPVSRARTLDGQLYYPNCAAARSDGRRNIRRGQPGYRRGLDRDGDGVACEG